MSNPEDTSLEEIEGLEPVDPDAVKEVKREMTDLVVPRIVSAVEERRLAAAENRGKPLKY